MLSISGELESGSDVTDSNALGFYQKAIQLSIGLGSVEAVQKAFAVLSEGGRVEFPPTPDGPDKSIASVIDINNIWWFLRT